MGALELRAIKSILCNSIIERICLGICGRIRRRIRGRVCRRIRGRICGSIRRRIRRRIRRGISRSVPLVPALDTRWRTCWRVPLVPFLGARILMSETREKQCGGGVGHHHLLVGWLIGLSKIVNEVDYSFVLLFQIYFYGIVSRTNDLKFRNAQFKWFLCTFRLLDLSLHTGRFASIIAGILFTIQRASQCSGVNSRNVDDAISYRRQDRPSLPRSQVLLIPRL